MLDIFDARRQTYVCTFESRKDTICNAYMNCKHKLGMLVMRKVNRNFDLLPHTHTDPRAQYHRDSIPTHADRSAEKTEKGRGELSVCLDTRKLDH